MKILVVDDERLLVKGIKFNLENEGYQVSRRLPVHALDGDGVVRARRRMGRIQIQQRKGRQKRPCFPW